MDEDITQSVNEHDFISYRSVPSLEKIATVTLVGNLWLLPELEEPVRNIVHRGSFFCSNYKGKEHRELENKLGKILPSKLLNEASSYIEPLGVQMLQWLSHVKENYPNLYDSTSVGTFICWGMYGTIDKCRTFESMLSKGNKENLRDLFQMACEECLQDHVLELWQKVQQGGFDFEESISFLISYWTRFARYSKLFLALEITSNYYSQKEYKNAFKLLLEQCNVEAVKFFWSKFSDVDKKCNVLSWTKKVIKCNDIKKYKRAELLCFLLSEMNSVEQQREAFKHNSEEILSLLLQHWSLHEYLLPTIGVMWDFLSERNYSTFLSIVGVEIVANRASRDLLIELWQQSPLRLKKGFIQNIDSLLSVLFRLEDDEIMKMILNEADVEEKDNIAFAIIHSTHMFELMNLKELQFFLNLMETLSCKKDIEIYKQLLLEQFSITFAPHG